MVLSGGGELVFEFGSNCKGEMVLLIAELVFAMLAQP